MFLLATGGLQFIPVAHRACADSGITTIIAPTKATM
jgi:hypothetical protein